jgi:hypothetical protein
MLALLVATGGVGYWAASGARRQAMLFRVDTLRKLGYSAELNAYQAEAYARGLRSIETEDPQKRETYRAEGHEFRTKIDTILNEYDRAIPADEVQERRAFDEFVETRKQYRAVWTQISGLLSNGQVEVARQLADTDLIPAYERYTAAGDVLYQHEIAAGDRHARDIERRCSQAQFLTAFICVGVFVAGILTQFIVFLFTRPSRPTEMSPP